jgi:hypothetical protein
VALVRCDRRARRDPRIACLLHGAGAVRRHPLAGGLSALGIPNEAALGYEKTIVTQKFVFIVEADAQGSQRAREVLPHADFTTFDSP